MELFLSLSAPSFTSYSRFVQSFFFTFFFSHYFRFVVNNPAESTFKLILIVSMWTMINQKVCSIWSKLNGNELKWRKKKKIKIKEKIRWIIIKRNARCQKFCVFFFSFVLFHRFYLILVSKLCSLCSERIFGVWLHLWAVGAHLWKVIYVWTKCFSKG